jgi:ATP-dependent Clp protease adapter protein ClpS
MPGTITLPVPVMEPDLDHRADCDHGWKVLLFNDDVTPFETVILALQRAAGLSLEVAEMVAWAAHAEGQAVVKRGLDEDDAKIICGGLRRWTRVAGLCPGVHCTAEPDDP